ncbi:hypothetical protein [Clostridium botulinum]|nr:hypothetical protein [Clostridium botulinum]
MSKSENRTKEQIKRDDYYNYLMKRYNCYDAEKIIDVITDKENNKREKIELTCI